MFANLIWLESEHENISGLLDGKPFSVPADPDNRHYAEIMRQVADEGLVIAEYVNKVAWATYRQALRDITLQADPLNIVWPAK